MQVQVKCKKKLIFSEGRTDVTFYFQSRLRRSSTIT